MTLLLALLRGASASVALGRIGEKSLLLELGESAMEEEEESFGGRHHERYYREKEVMLPLTEMTV